MIPAGICRPNVMDDIRSGKIQFRELPVRQSVEDWNDFWTRYKSKGA